MRVRKALKFRSLAFCGGGGTPLISLAVTYWSYALEQLLQARELNCGEIRPCGEFAAFVAGVLGNVCVFEMNTQTCAAGVRA